MKKTYKMKKAQRRLLLSVLILGALGTAVAFAQENGTKEAVQLSLEERYQKCMDDKDCTAQERWMIIDDMAHEMRTTQQHMRDTCRDMQFKNDCLGTQEKEREQWHKMHTHMRDMMRSMEHKNFWDKN